MQTADPAFTEYLIRARPNRNILTVSCAPECSRQVSRACGHCFSKAAMPLFHLGSMDSRDDGEV
jgi:hypothetical protein